MSTATTARKRADGVSAMRLMDVLGLYIDPSLKRDKYECRMSELWGKWTACARCHTNIAPADNVLWDGENGAFAHAGHVSQEQALPWSKVKLPGNKDSVAEKLEQKREREEAMAAQEVA